MEQQYNLIDLAKAKENLLKMLVDRGYLSPDNVASLENAQEANAVSFNLELEHPKFNKIAVIIFNTHEKIKKDALTEFVNYCLTLQKEKDKKINLIMVISKTNQTALQPKSITELNNELRPKKINVEIFGIDDLQFCITESNLNPVHTLLSPDEIKQLFKDYNITHKNQLPKILHTDPNVKYYGAEVGDVFKISRNSETTGQSFYYRLVI